MSNKTDVLSFDGWAKFQGLSLEKDDNGLYVNRHTHYARKGWEAKPEKAEIGELKKNFNNALKTIDIQQQFLDDTDGTIKIITSQVDELQSRIDDLKSFCIKGVESNMLSIEYNQALIDMHKILKGEETK